MFIDLPWLIVLFIIIVVVARNFGYTRGFKDGKSYLLTKFDEAVEDGRVVVKTEEPFEEID